MKKKKSIFRKTGEMYAYVQAFIDDTIHLAFKKLEEEGKKKESPEEEKKIHKKVMKGVGKAVGDAGSGFYEKYAELKQGENLAEQAYGHLPVMKRKAKLMKTKMDVLGVKKGDLESLKKLKNPRGDKFDDMLRKAIRKDINNDK